jgi:hypothetical protein
MTLPEACRLQTRGSATVVPGLGATQMARKCNLCYPEPEVASISVE